MRDKFNYRNVTMFLASQIVSLLGSSLAQSVIMWYITIESGSATLLTIAVIAGFIPTFLVSPFAGVWADRHDRKKIMMLSDGMVAFATIGLVIAFRLGYASEHYWIIFTAMAIRGFGQGMQQPAVGAFLPQLVPQDKLMRVNSINSSAQGLMLLISPAVAGVLITLFPIEVTLAIDIVTATAAILLLQFCVMSHQVIIPKDQRKKASYFGDLKLGIKYIKNHKYAGRFFLYVIPLAVLTAPVAILFQLIIRERFGADEWRLALNDSVFAAGMIAGSVLMMTWGGFRNRLKTIVLGCILMSLATAAYGIVPSFWLFLSISVVIGIAMPLFNTPAQVLLQENIDNEYLGRVMSIMNMTINLGMPIGMLIFGPIGDLIGLKLEFILVGAVMLMLTLIFAFDKRVAGIDKHNEHIELINEVIE